MAWCLVILNCPAPGFLLDVPPDLHASLHAATLFLSYLSYFVSLPEYLHAIIHAAMFDSEHSPDMPASFQAALSTYASSRFIETICARHVNLYVYICCCYS